MLTVDFLHEVELGVWKALSTHLIRMLHACGKDKVHQFDERYVSLAHHSNHLPRTSFRCRVLKGLHLIFGRYETSWFAWVNKQADQHLSQGGLKFKIPQA
jgi:hypothetical protein